MLIDLLAPDKTYGNEVDFFPMSTLILLGGVFRRLSSERLIVLSSLDGGKTMSRRCIWW